MQAPIEWRERRNRIQPRWEWYWTGAAAVAPSGQMLIDSVGGGFFRGGSFWWRNAGEQSSEMMEENNANCNVWNKNFNKILEWRRMIVVMRFGVPFGDGVRLAGS